MSIDISCVANYAKALSSDSFIVISYRVAHDIIDRDGCKVKILVGNGEGEGFKLLSEEKFVYWGEPLFEKLKTKFMELTIDIPMVDENYINDYHWLSHKDYFIVWNLDEQGMLIKNDYIVHFPGKTTLKIQGKIKSVRVISRFGYFHSIIGELDHGFQVLYSIKGWLKYKDRKLLYFNELSQAISEHLAVPQT